MKLQTILFALALIVFSSEFCSGQDKRSYFNGLKENAVHLTPGVQGLTLSYERKLWHPKKTNPLFRTITSRFEGGVFWRVRVMMMKIFTHFTRCQFQALQEKGKITLKWASELLVQFTVKKSIAV